MGETTGIAWCDSTFNPFIGCTKVSPACTNCYAEKLGARLGVEWGPGKPRRRTSVSNWNLPRRWDRQHDRFQALFGRRRRVFCASLADVFDNEVDPSWRSDLFKLIKETPNLDWLLLTKRAGNIQKMLPDDWDDQDGMGSGCYPNVWLGSTVVTQEEADRDIPKLLAVVAQVHFISVEPMLEAMNVARWLWQRESPEDPYLDWVIVGGESGKAPRPMPLDLPRDLRAQCRHHGTAFFMKQGSQADWSNFKDFASFPKDLQIREFPK